MLHREVEAEIDAGRLSVGDTLWMTDVCYLPRRKRFERNLKPIEVRINEYEYPRGYLPDKYYYTAVNPADRNPWELFQESWQAREEDRARYFLTESEAHQSYKEQAAKALEAMEADRDSYSQRFLNLKVLLLSI